MSKSSIDLIANVRLRAQLPSDSGQTISDNDILSLASDELQNVIAPKIYAMRGWHYAAEKVIALTADRRYRIPSRAAGGTIVSVEIVNSQSPNRLVNYVHPLQTSMSSGQVSAETYHLYANNIVLSSGCPTSGSMLVRYLIMPSSLVKVGDAVASINGAFVELITNTVGFQDNDKFDLVVSDSPYELVMKDVVVNSVGGFNLFTDFDLTTDAGVRQNSTVADMTAAQLASLSLIAVRPGTSLYPQINDDFHDLLAQKTAMRCMEAIGHTEDLTNMGRKLADLDRAFNEAIAPRARGDIKVIQTEDFFYGRRF